MALLTFFLLTISAFYFYKWSERNYLSLAFSLMTFSMGLWSGLLVLSEIPFPLSVRILLVNLIPIPPLFIPILLTYVIFNYTKPYALVFPPTLLMLIHVIAILFFSWLALEGSVSPFRMIGTERVFDPGSFYYPSCAYIYASILICAGVLLRNIFIGDYFVRLHSIYLFTGVVLGGVVSSIFVVFLPLLGISLTSMAVLGVIVFLWFAWIPVTKYRLFNIELTDFKHDFRNPRLSSAFILRDHFRQSVPIE
ncbi:hypothetical protein LEP1GSC047_0249 [Leptospira inadai serovar Lyme str. 10]|uniref:Histidine kinase N-terminal 7TM region domain-containing protein n=1 Tax=Leptospira inadai serovar Lyme str. 10 TaxID=1049790 RepID=V6HTA7_9LEPT|nr:hypothetical protein LEP1GSC047_0249 [Leptospira inadai serovar Lyme str. 10]